MPGRTAGRASEPAALCVPNAQRLGSGLMMTESGGGFLLCRVSLTLLGFAIIGSVVPDAALIAAMKAHLPGTLPRPDAAA